MMSDLSAVSVCPTSALPLITGRPVARLMRSLAASGSVGPLVTVSSLPRSSV